MNNLERKQLDMLKTLPHTVDGKDIEDVPDNFDRIVFHKVGSGNAVSELPKTLIFTFEDYIIKPFNGFDFHEKFNRGIAPPFKTMEGEVIKETEKMVYLSCKSHPTTSKFCNHCLKYGVANYLCDNCKKLYNNIDTIMWAGWCPKKSVDIKEI